MSKHQDIIDNLITRLGTLTKVNGYSINIGGNVKEWAIERSIDTIDETELPFIDVRDDDPVQITWAGYFEYDLPVNIDIWVSGKQSKAEARQVVFNVFEVLNTDRTLSGVADEIFPQSYQITVGHGDKIITNIKVQILVKFHTAEWTED